MDSVKIVCAISVVVALVLSPTEGLLCHMCGTTEFPQCDPNPGPVIGCPAGTRCWTLYDDVLKEHVKARGCSFDDGESNGCARGPQGTYRCFCGERHLCNGSEI